MTHADGAAAPRPFRFGVVAARATSGAEWQAKVRRIESLGYAIVLVPDRVGGTLAPLPALAAAASATARLRVGTFVLAAGLQHGALLARDCATVDLLSDGRLEIGLGAGVSEADFQRVGVPYGTPGERVERLSATVQALKHALEAASAAGSPAAYPAPAQRPYPPLLLAGSGRRVLSLAAREAVIVAVSTGRDFSEAALAERIAWLGEAASERFHQLELSINLAGLAVDGVVPPQVHQRMQMFMQADAEAVARSGSPFLPSGSITDIGDQLQGFRERLGISYIQVSEDLMDAFAPVVARLTGR